MIRSKVLLTIVGFLFCYFSTHTYAGEPYLVQDLEIGSSESSPNYITEMNGSTFFSAYKVISAPAVGCELWKSNGATNDIQLLYDHRTGISFSDCPYDLIVFKNKLYFFTNNSSSSIGLWQSDGTTDGTLMLKEVDAGRPAVTGDKLFFLASEQSTGAELWVSDGTTEGTKILKDINPGTSSSNISSITVVGNKIFFMANDGFHGSELWCSDGTEIGTFIVKEINTQNVAWNPVMVAMNGILYFTAAGGGLWRSDGTQEGTTIVSNSCYNPGNLVAAEGKLFFTGVGDRVNALWVSDGTGAGTNIVMSAPGNPTLLTPVGQKIFFTYYDSFGRELWISDGTSDGTKIVKDLSPGLTGSLLSDFANIDGILYFAGADGLHGAELWRSDGTTDGTYMIADIFHDNQHSSPGSFTKAGNLMFFTADDGIHGRELWAMPLLTLNHAVIGVFRPSIGMWFLDRSGNGTWNDCSTDKCINFGIQGDIPVTGDWNGDGTTKIGVFRPSIGWWFLDYNGNGQWDGCSTDRCYNLGISEDTPVTGDWDGNGKTEIGVFRKSIGWWFLDYNGDGTWSGCSADRCYNLGISEDTPVTGDWNGDGKTEIGVFRPSIGWWFVDVTGNGTWNGCGTDGCYNLGIAEDLPVTGDWNGDGFTEIGVFRPSIGYWFLDYNGNDTWNDCTTDRCYQFGISVDLPVSGAF